MRVDIYHNILWSKYKGSVFSSLNELYSGKEVDYSFYQIAASSGQRAGLSSVDLSYHKYPYRLFFEEDYEKVPWPKRCFVLMKSVWASKADLIVIAGYHEVEYWAMLLLCLTRRKKRAVFVDATGFDQPKSAVRYWLKRLFFKMCDGFFCYGTRSREYIKSFSVPDQKIFTRCQAAALPHDYDSSVIMRGRANAAPVCAGFQFLYVGRLSSEKGLDVLLKAFKLALQSFPDARLKVVGAGPILGELQALRSSLALDGFVDFVGGVELSQLSEYYLQSSCLVLPSRSEPWGLVINEAMSYGCPVIVSDHCGCAPDLVIVGSTGYVFKTDDVADLADKMKLMVAGLSGSVRFGENCLNLINNYTPANAAEQINTGCLRILRPTLSGRS